MTVFAINPIQDPRWLDFLRRHPKSSAFHAPAWLQSLQRTYGYTPVVFTTSPPSADMKNGLVFCEIRSWLTGSRLVSLPFSDHCQPLVDDVAELGQILATLKRDAKRKRWKYIELRPLNDLLGLDATEFGNSASYHFHRIDLSLSKEVIFRSFHESCIRRKIRKAEREQLVYEAGTSDRLLRAFRHLMLLTRRRHQLPPQPFSWFQNLTESMANQLTIHMVSKEGNPVASIMTLRHNRSWIYKYGCSDEKFHYMGGTPLLFWKAIQEAKESGATDFDLGRSQVEDLGLADFKGHLGGIASNLTYYRNPSSLRKKPSPAVPLFRRAFARMPDSLFVGAGRLLYRHIG